MFENRQNMTVDHFCNGDTTFNVTNNNNGDVLKDLLRVLPELVQLCRDNESVRFFLVGILEQLVNLGNPSPSAELGPKKAHDAAVNEIIRQEIIQYARKVCVHLADEWKSDFDKLWIEILGKKVVTDAIYRVGKQQGTNFNRNLVAHILYYMDRYGAYGKRYNAAVIANYLEGSKDSSIRAALKKEPPVDIVECLDRILRDWGYCRQDKK